MIRGELLKRFASIKILRFSLWSMTRLDQQIIDILFNYLGHLNMPLVTFKYANITFLCNSRFYLYLYNASLLILFYSNLAFSAKVP